MLRTYVRSPEFRGTVRMVSIDGRKYNTIFEYIEINSSGQN